MITADQTTIHDLGPCRMPSPLGLSTVYGDGIGNYVRPGACVRYDIDLHTGAEDAFDVFFEMAGPRQQLFFEPASCRALIVTCGGLCPGLNNVIRSLYRQLASYGVQEIFGARYGYRGMVAHNGIDFVRLTDEMVEPIHRQGGTILGSSRGMQPVGETVDLLEERGINLLFTVGGDGTQRGAHDLAMEIGQRRLPISVIGIPKTIDNDIRFISRSFGYTTAVAEASRVLECAHMEAKGTHNGIGLVKVMGRQSGFIAAGAALASQVVNFCLVPELPFQLEGDKGLFALLEERLRRKPHALLVVAEGAGQDLMPQSNLGADASGNSLQQDIGPFLKQAITDHFRGRGIETHLKYIDPSYIVRSVPANYEDTVLCDKLGRHAVHAAMAGKTDMLVGQMHETYIHVPIALATLSRKVIDPEGDLWLGVHEVTNQPLRFDP